MKSNEKQFVTIRDAQLWSYNKINKTLTPLRNRFIKAGKTVVGIVVTVPTEGNSPNKEETLVMLPSLKSNIGKAIIKYEDVRSFFFFPASDKKEKRYITIRDAQLWSYNKINKTLTPLHRFIKTGKTVTGIAVTVPTEGNSPHKQETLIMLPSMKSQIGKALIKYQDVRPVDLGAGDNSISQFIGSEQIKKAKSTPVGAIAVGAISGGGIGYGIDLIINSLAYNRLVWTPGIFTLGGAVIGAISGKNGGDEKFSPATGVRRPSPSAAPAIKCCTERDAQCHCIKWEWRKSSDCDTVPCGATSSGADGDYSGIITEGHYCCPPGQNLSGTSCYGIDAAGNYVYAGKAMVCKGRAGSGGAKIVEPRKNWFTRLLSPKKRLA